MNVSEKDAQQYSGHRLKMVESQLVGRGIKDARVLEAMRNVPRHLFVPGALQHKAHGEHPLPIGEDQTISQPYMVGIMSEALRISEGDRVLEIGTGSGYQTAVLAELAGQVFTIERIRSIGLAAQKILNGLGYQNIVYKIFDGSYGWRDQSPYDAILITAGVREIPKTLVEQLKDGGRMVIPVGGDEKQSLTVATKNGSQIDARVIAECKFVRLVGKYGWTEAVKP